jgi:hypothetical protein
MALAVLIWTASLAISRSTILARSSSSACNSAYEFCRASLFSSPVMAEMKSAMASK